VLAGSLGVEGGRLERVGSSIGGGPVASEDPVASEGGEVDSVGRLAGGGALSVVLLDPVVPRFGGDG
jgi:hypothetical protein